MANGKTISPHFFGKRGDKNIKTHFFCYFTNWSSKFYRKKSVPAGSCVFFCKITENVGKR
jgi:hypothetical protein